MLRAAFIIFVVFVLCKYADVHTNDDILHFLFVHRIYRIYYPTIHSLIRPVFDLIVSFVNISRLPS